MVPRAYAANPFGSSPLRDYDEKENYRQQTQPKEIPKRKKRPQLSSSPPRTRSTSSFNSNASTPSAHSSSYRAQLRPSLSSTTIRIQNDGAAPAQMYSPLRRRESAQDILAATAIPIRKKPKQRSRQRLPECDHVSDFSRLLLGDVKQGSNGSASNSLGNPQYDGLFGYIDEMVEGEMIVGSNGIDAGILTTRSMSTESMASLASPDDFSSGDNASASLSMSRSHLDRKVRQLPRSESCEQEHPLMQFEKEESPAADLHLSPPERKIRPRDRKPGAFKSSLTASLKAIKSAAQSMSNYATSPSIQPDDFLTHSVFDFQPAMTDDRRPPPSSEPPSPAVRRYLNPDYSTHPDSPAQLHFWLDYRTPTPSSSRASQTKPSDPTASFKPKIKKKYTKDAGSTSKAGSDTSKLPPVVPLATCIPSAIRTAHASSPPIWLGPDGTPSNKRTATQSNVAPDEAGAAFGGLKQREPRENRDFLRVFVCEMEMRRHGKLDEAAEGRAKLWLPPVDEKVGGKEGEIREERNGVEGGRPEMGRRWQSWSAGDL
jgi:hypothetical protein